MSDSRVVGRVRGMRGGVSGDVGVRAERVDGGQNPASVSPNLLR